MTPWEAVKALADIPADDPEDAHAKADAVLLQFVPEDVRREYQELQDQCGAWWFA